MVTCHCELTFSPESRRACINGDVVLSTVRFSPVPLCRLYGCDGKDIFDEHILHSRCQPVPVQLHYEVFERNVRCPKQLPRKSHPSVECGDILRVHFPVPTSECTNEGVFQLQGSTSVVFLCWLSRVINLRTRSPELTRERS